MVEIPDRLRHACAHSGRALQVFQGRCANLARRAEMQQQSAFSRRTNAGYLIERRGLDRFAALRPMRTNDIAVHFIAKVLEIEQHRRIGRQGLLAPIGKVEDFAPLAPVMRPLGNSNQRHILYPHFSKLVTHRAHLTFAAINQHQIGPHGLIAFLARRLAIRIILHCARKPALHNLAHHAVIIIGLS